MNPISKNRLLWLGVLAGFAAGAVLTSGLAGAQDGPRVGGDRPTRPIRPFDREVPGRYSSIQMGSGCLGVLDTASGLIHIADGREKVSHIDLAHSRQWETPLEKVAPPGPLEHGPMPPVGGLPVPPRPPPPPEPPPTPETPPPPAPGDK